MNVDIDPEMIISLVKQTPVLWDRNQQDYKSRICTKDAWRDVCAQVMPEFNVMSEVYKENFEKHVMKKWRNIKDNYIKSRKKFRRDSQKKYIFHKYLTFLDSTIDAQELRTSCSWSSDNDESKLPLSTLVEDTGEDIEADSCSDMKANLSFVVTKAEKPDVSEECTFPDTLSSPPVNVEDNPYSDSFGNQQHAPVPTKFVEENRHMLFFKSVLPSLKDFSDDDTLAFQAAVISAIRDIKRECSNNSKWT